jgi:hypothetical protein
MEGRFVAGWRVRLDVASNPFPTFGTRTLSD